MMLRKIKEKLLRFLKQLKHLKENLRKMLR